MNNNSNFVSIPIEILVGKKQLENNDYYPFKKIKVNNKYNLLDENNQVVSDIWFTRIEGDFRRSDEIVVSKNGSKFNIFGLDRKFLFDEWYFYVKKIPYDKECKEKSYIVLKDENKYNIFVKGKGFISDKWYSSCEPLSRASYIYKLKDVDGNKMKLYNSKTNELYSDEYSRIDSFVFNDFCIVTKIIYERNESFIAKATEIYNVLDFNKNELLCDTWAAEPPKEGVDDNHLIIYGDKNLGYYIVNSKKEISEKFDSVIYIEHPTRYSFSDTYKFESFNGLIVATKGDKHILIGKDGECIKDNNAIINILLRKIKY